MLAADGSDKEGGAARRRLQTADTSVAVGDLLFEQDTGGCFSISRAGAKTPTVTVLAGQAATAFGAGGVLSLRGGDGSANAPGGAVALDGGDGDVRGHVRIGFASDEVALNGAKVTGSLNGATGQPLCLGTNSGGIELGRAGDATAVAGTLAIGASGALAIDGSAALTNGVVVRCTATVDGVANVRVDVHATVETGVA